MSWGSCSEHDLVFENVYWEIDELQRVEALRDRQSAAASPTKDGQLTMLGEPGTALAPDGQDADLEAPGREDHVPQPTSRS